MQREGGSPVYVLMGASSKASKEREENDFYATDPKAIECLLDAEKFTNVWEVACGQGHLSNVLRDRGLHGLSSDLIDRGYQDSEVIDFLNSNKEWDGDIITNPPFTLAQEFIEKALSLLKPGRKCAFLLRIQFLESEKRRNLFKNTPPKKIHVFTRRVFCAKNGDFSLNKGGALAYAWFVWEKNWKGETVLKWIN